MAAITASPFHRTRPAAPARPVAAAPTSDAVPGPDERSLARTTAVVVTSLVLLIGLVVGAAYGAGSIVNAVAEWFFNR